MKYITDKYESGLIVEYEGLFSPVKDKPAKYLEVGVFRGGSLQWAADYFAHPESIVVGIDKDFPPDYPSDRFAGKIKVHRGDQHQPLALAAIAAGYGAFDVIVDDGCHFAALTKATFEALWPFLRSGGIYVIEDFAAAYKHKDRDQYAGMPELVGQIMAQSVDLGVSGLYIINNVIHKSTNGSFAAFWKE